MKVYVVLYDQVDREIEGIYSDPDVAFDIAKKLRSEYEHLKYFKPLVEIFLLDKED